MAYCFYTRVIPCLNFRGNPIVKSKTIYPVVVKSKTGNESLNNYREIKNTVDRKPRIAQRMKLPT